MIERRNMNTDPECLKAPAMTWACKWSRDEAGKIVALGTYTPNGGALCGTIRTWRGSLAGLAGYILCTITSGMSPEYAAMTYHKDAETIAQLDLPDGWHATVSRISLTSHNNEFCLFGPDPVTIQACGIYSTDDWDAILALHEQGRLEYPYFDGSNYPT